MKKDKATILFSDAADTPGNITTPSRRTALRSLSLAAPALGLAIGAQPGSAATKKIKLTKNSAQGNSRAAQGHSKATHRSSHKDKAGPKSSGDGYFKRSKN